MLAIARHEGFECYCLTVEYGQRHQAELESAKAVAESVGIRDHKFVAVDLRGIGGSALTADIDVPKDEVGAGGIPVTYVPARNTVMLSLALGYAEVVGAEAIFVGVNAVDYSGYPDCRPEYVDAFQALATLATKAGVEGRPLAIMAPLIHMTKVDIIKEGLKLGVDYGLTTSCYDPGSGGSPCGHCDACLIRGRAFQALGLVDPAVEKAKSVSGAKG